MSPIQYIDAEFFTENLSFGNTNRGNDLPCFVSRNYFGHLSVNYVEDDRDLKQSTIILNRAVNEIKTSEVQLQDKQILHFTKNCESLNRKVEVWNQKVNDSRWVGFLDKIFWVFSLFSVNYRQSLIVERINVQDLRELKSSAQNRVRGNLSPLAHSLFKGALARSKFKILRNVILIQSTWRMYRTRKQYLEDKNRGFFGRCFKVVANIANDARNGVGKAANYLFRQAVRHGPALVVKYTFKLAMMQICADAGLNYGDVAALGTAWRYADNGGRL